MEHHSEKEDIPVVVIDSKYRDENDTYNLVKAINSHIVSIKNDILDFKSILDEIDNKVTEIHTVHERIKKESTFKRTYTSVPLYGAKYYSHNDEVSDNETEEEEEEEEYEEDEEEEYRRCCKRFWCNMCYRPCYDTSI